MPDSENSSDILHETNHGTVADLSENTDSFGDEDISSSDFVIPDEEGNFSSDDEQSDFKEETAAAKDAKSSGNRSKRKSIMPPVEQTDEEKEADKKIRAESMRIMASLGNFGIFLILAVLFSYVIGNAMDKFFDTKPIFTIFWIVCGVLSSIRELVRNIRKAMKLAEDPKPEDAPSTTPEEKENSTLSDAPSSETDKKNA